jgi:hypothetical protein
MSVHFNETTRRYIPEGCHRHFCCRENLNSHVFLNNKQYDTSQDKIVSSFRYFLPLLLHLSPKFPFIKCS